MIALSHCRHTIAIAVSGSLLAMGGHHDTLEGVGLWFGRRYG